MCRIPFNIPKWVSRSSRAQPESRRTEAESLPGSGLLTHFQALCPLRELGEGLKTHSNLGPLPSPLPSGDRGFFVLQS